MIIINNEFRLNFLLSAIISRILSVIHGVFFRLSTLSSTSVAVSFSVFVIMSHSMST